MCEIIATVSWWQCVCVGGGIVCVLVAVCVGGMANCHMQ